MSSAGKLCVMAVVTHNYQQFLPTLAFSTLRTYPAGTTLLLATSGKFRGPVRAALEPLKQLGDIRMLEHVFDDMPHRSQEDAAFRRFMFDHPMLDEFDYLYIPDSDLFMCPETPTLIEQHVAQAEQFNLPYSNVLYEKAEYVRLRGWHFMIREPYLKIMRPHMARYRDLVRRGHIHRGTRDEHLLWRMVVEAGLDVPPRGTPFLGHHGIHLGLWMKRYRKRRPTLPDIYVQDPLVPGYFEHYLRHARDPLYQRGAELIRYELDYMEREHCELLAGTSNR